MKRQTILKSALCLFMALVCLPMAMQAKVEHLLPRPQEVTVTENAAFELSGNVTINYAEGVTKCELLEEFFTTNGCTLAEGGKAVNVSLVESIDGAYDYELHGYENEAYTLEVTANKINITAVTGTGIIRAAQTLTQLAEGYAEGETKAIEALTMKDWPAFKLRGYMHDVGRSFISTDELVKQIEKFSRFKVNTFHWHLTENQAWRFEVKAYPELTSSESMTRFPGQYYTQDDCKLVMATAKKHGVIVIPEIDMPGHSEAFERAMGFNMQTEEGKVVLKKVIDEAVEVFAGAPYIHIGGDEVTTTAAYLNEMIAYAESKGANVKGGLWNPINDIGQDALNNTLAQMWGTRGYLASGKANIDCRYNYTNHFDVFADLVGIYKSTIYYSQQGSTEVAGAISGCWNDRKVADEVAIMAQNNVWANVIATAERAWIGGGKQYIDNATNTPDSYKANPYGGGVMLPNSGEEYEEFKSWEERFLFHKANFLKGEPIPYVKQTNVRWRITDAFPNGGSKTAAFGPEEAGMTASTDLLPEVFTHEGKTYYTGMATGAGIYLAHTWGNSIINAYYSNPQFNHTAYAWTYVYSPEAQTVGAQIEFQNYSRSEQDAAAPAGSWDHFGSKIWVNGEEIAAPTWENTGVSISSKEVELKNENFPGRNPIEVTLKQGWNKVFLKLPYMNTGYRLKKWMFTFVLTDLEGKNAVEGLIYSPNQCMDEATEAVAAKVSEIKRDRGNLIGTAVGLWPESTATELDTKVSAIEATYAESKTAEERASQVEELTEAWEAFTESLTGDKINLPVSGNYYRMYTPGRESRYPTAQGKDKAIIGEQNPMTKASIWQFISRNDNSYDIINLADGTYISPASNDNTALNAVEAKPNTGWVVKAAGSGKVIITSGNSVQLHQTNNGNGNKLFNWGANSSAGTFNTTDGGCVYQMVDVTAIAPATPIKMLANCEEFENGGVYSFVTERGWMGATASSNNAISTARTTVTPEASNDNPYFQWTVYKSNNNNYYLYNIGKEKFMGVQSSNNTSVPFVDSPESKQLTFKNSSSTAYPIMFSTDNAGVVNHSPHHGEGLVTWTGGWNTLNDAGSNHKVALICKLEDEALANIADIVADYEFNDVPITSAEEFSNNGIYTFVTPRGWVGGDDENDKVIGTVKPGVTVDPAASAKNAYFQWAVYKSNNDNYYLYNLGKKKFLALLSDNTISFVDNPTSKALTFKSSTKTEYPIMISPDSKGTVSQNSNAGLFYWGSGLSNPGDEGNTHKVSKVGELNAETLKSISDLVEAYDKTLPVKAEVFGLGENNPNTHFGSVRATSTSGSLSTKLKIGNITDVAYVDYDGTQETTIDFTREYRGFEFQGYYLGEESLGKSFTLTDDQKNNISAENPVVAKFTTTDEVTLFYDDDPSSYRIPAIATTNTGRLIAVSDYRHCLDDIGMNRWGKGYRIDLVIRTSDDNGKTWSTKKTIAEGIDNSTAENCAYGDAAIAIVGKEVIVMAVAGSTQYGTGNADKISRLVRVYSSDNGDTWEKTDITEEVYGHEGSLYPTVYTAFFGSGKLAVDPNFNKSGTARIYGSLLTQGKGNQVIYSDDKGLTWLQLGTNERVSDANEPKVEILPSGQILFSARRNGGRNFNVFTYTNKATSEGTWGSAINGCDNEGQNGTNGETFLINAKNANGENVKLLLQSQPVGGGAWDRENVSIWYKEINSATDYNHTPSEIATGWTKGIQVSQQKSAYSAMSLQANGKIAFFFEEAPCYDDNHNYGYCMVYMPLTIENITKGNYFSEDADLTVEQNINVVLTDEQGNEYRDQVQSNLTGVATALAAKYSYITLGNEAELNLKDGVYTYTNTVTLPFKVSSAKTTVWHNIYFPSNGGQTGYPVYMSAEANNDVVKIATEAVEYGNSSLNMQANADKISWAIYQSGDGFSFMLKNKQNGKYIMTTSTATSSDGGDNVIYTDDADNASVFTITDGRSNNRRGDYGLTSNGGNLMVWSTGHGRVTYSTNTNHEGAWLKFIEAPDYTALIASITEPLASGLYGDNLGQYKPTGDTDLEAIRTAMENSSNVKLNTLNSYKNLLEGATLNMPQAGQYFRVAYDYGGNVGKLYMQSTASSVKGLQFAAETGNASVWVYYDDRLYSYVEGKNLREDGNDRGLSETKTTAEFTASTRAKGKYNIKCGSFVHANSSNGNYFTDHCGSNSCTQHDLILESVDMRPSAIVTTIGEHEIATFYANSAMAIPAGVTAYVATTSPVSKENGEYGIYMTAIEDGIIPAETGVVIRGNAGYYTFTPAESAATTDVTNNLMRGYAGVFECEKVALPEDGSTNYVLAVEGSQVGFYKKESAFKVYNNKAYLKVPNVQGARSLVIRFGDEETTDIENSEITNQNSEIVFDLQGRRVLTPTKGIYIVNGKKMVK